MANDHVEHIRIVQETVSLSHLFLCTSHFPLTQDLRESLLPVSVLHFRPSASRLQSYLQRFCSRETFQLISFPLCGALPPTPLFHSLFLDSTIMKKAFFVKNVSPDFTNLSGVTVHSVPSNTLRDAQNLC